MKDVVSFETAVRLKEAGFPQPVPENGQFWYNEDKDLGVLGNCISATWDFTWSSVGENYDGYDGSYRDAEEMRKDYIFAPTATDILRKLPERPIVWNIQEDAWFVWEPPELTSRIITITMDDNPAEAAAQAWLIDNEK